MRIPDRKRIILGSSFWIQADCYRDSLQKASSPAPLKMGGALSSDHLPLRYSSVTAHKPCHLLDTLQRKWWQTEGPHGDGHELHRIVIGRHPVRIEFPAATAPMDDCPFPVFSYPHCNRIHDPATVRAPVSRLIVNMQADQAIRTMVPVSRPSTLRRHETAADFAFVAVFAFMRLVISLLILLPFIFPIHFDSPLKSNLRFLLEACVSTKVRKPPG